MHMHVHMHVHTRNVYMLCTRHRCAMPSTAILTMAI
jgi:hypothetical protein